MDANRLRLNEAKTEAIIFSMSSSSKKRTAPAPLIVNGSSIDFLPHVRNLGVILDSHLTMSTHIRAICRRAYFHLRRIARIKKYLTSAAVAQLVHAFVSTQLDYGNSLLVGLPTLLIQKLQTVQNAVARLVTGSRRRESITPHLRSLHWLPIQHRIHFKIATLVFKCLHGCAPEYLSCLIVPYRPQRELRSTYQLNLVIPPSRTKSYGDRSFSVAGPTIWNSLPLTVRSAQSFNTFRTLLKSHLFKKAFTTIN